MLTINDVIARQSPPVPWSEGDNIPWDDPEFSQRMLAEHLSQHHDLASRRTARIDHQVAALLESDIPPAPARVLDLACGPGLYLHRIAAAGHHCHGIDFAPAAIDHAIANATGLHIEYRLEDLRVADFGSGYDTVLFLYGQLNVFRRSEAEAIVSRAYDALEPSGHFVIEAQTYAQITSLGAAPSVWSSHETGLFSADPHLLLTESSWNEDTTTGTQRFYVVDAATGSVFRHALSNEAYTKAQLTALLEKAGFQQIEHRASLTGEELDDGLSVVVGVKAA